MSFPTGKIKADSVLHSYYEKSTVNPKCKPHQANYLGFDIQLEYSCRKEDAASSNQEFRTHKET